MKTRTVLCLCFMLLALSSFGQAETINAPSNAIWDTPIFIERGAGSAWGVQAAAGGNNSSSIVWVQRNDAHDKIWAKRYSGDWGPTILIKDSLDYVRYYSVKVAADARNTVVVWISSGKLWFARYTETAGWRTARIISGSSTEYIWYCDVSFDSDSNIIVVWLAWDGRYNHLCASQYIETIGWSTPSVFQIGRYMWSPQVAFNEGKIVAVWVQPDGNQNNVWAIRYTPGAGWETPAVVENNLGFVLESPRVVADSNGNAIAVWVKWGENGNKIFASYFLATTASWSMPFVIEVGGAGPEYIWSPPFTINQNQSRAVLVWSTWNEAQWQESIWALRYDSSSGWAAPVLIKDEAFFIWSPQVADNVVAWAGTDGSVWSSLHLADTGWVSTLVENGDSGFVSEPPKITVVNGRATIVWLRNYGSHYSVMASQHQFR